jgi:outer membrane protein assembly factor BamD
MALGIKQEAQTAAAVLGHNFPDSRWYKDAYALLQSDGLAPREDTGSWLSQVWKNVKLPKLSLGSTPSN